MILEWVSQNYVIVVITLGMLLLGLSSALIGVFNNIRSQALIGDGLSHAALPGIVIAYMLTQNRQMYLLIIGAAIGGVIAIGLMNIIKKYSKIKNDAALALILASFFGFGQILLLLVQYSGDSNASSLQNFIFGQVATILLEEVYIIGIVSIVVILLIVIFYKEIKLFLFNSEYFQTQGFSRRIINLILTIMTVLVVIVGIRMVGVVLMSSLLIAPGVSARQWSDKLSLNLVIAGAIGMISGLIGALISYQIAYLPTGPVIVLVLSIIVISSLLFSPINGILKEEIILFIQRHRIKKYSYLIHIYNNHVIKYDKDDLDNIKFSQYLDIKNNKVELNQAGSNLIIDIFGGDPHEY